MWLRTGSGPAEMATICGAALNVVESTGQRLPEGSPNDLSDETKTTPWHLHPGSVPIEN